MRHNSILKNVLLIALCAVLAGGLLYMVKVYREEERARSQELKLESEKVREAELQQRQEELQEKEALRAASADLAAASSSLAASSAEEDPLPEAAEEAEAEKEPSSEKAGTTASSAEDADSSTSSAASSAVSAAESSTASSSEEEEVLPLVISCRGDAFQEMDDADKATGYPAKLQAMLDEKSVDGEVMDYTWDMAGSLSQIRLAGVPQSVVDDLIDAHVKKAEKDGVTLRNTETQIRIDFDRVDTSREDEQAIPVICMGFYGGFGQDLDELAEQQQLLLETFELRETADGEEEFIIMGFYPSGWTDTEAYDKAMEKAWGDHYLSLNSHISGNAISDGGRQEIAEALLEKLEELGYIPSGD